MKRILGAIFLATLFAARVAVADTIAVVGQANIFGAGHASAPGGGLLPPVVNFGAPAPAGATVTFSSVTGLVSYNTGSGDNFNDPDGFGSASDVDVNSSTGISGIANDHAGFLAGVFLGAAEPADPAPARLLFNTGVVGGTTQTNVASLAPLLNQSFFIGDGLTGHGTGGVQTFSIPVGATRLFLGFADAGGYHGDPGAYDDNQGSFTANFSVNGIPEPTSLTLIAVGIAVAMNGRFNRRRTFVGTARS